MIIKKIIPSVFVLSVAVGLSGCATKAVQNVVSCGAKTGCSGTHDFKKRAMLKDTYIAIGKPVQPIAGFDNALILIGEKSTLILTPKTADDVKFFQNFHRFDLKDLSLEAKNTTITVVRDENLGNLSSGDIIKEHLGNPSSSVIIKFSRKNEFPATTNEKQLLNELGFRLVSNNTSVGADDAYFEYDKQVGFNITVAQAIPNANLQHTFRKPVSFEFVVFEQKEQKSRNALAVLFLPAFFIDVVTLPIQMVGESLFD